MKIIEHRRSLPDAIKDDAGLSKAVMFFVRAPAPRPTDKGKSKDSKGSKPGKSVETSEVRVYRWVAEMIQDPKAADMRLC